jgi:hypothetical protein
MLGAALLLAVPFMWPITGLSITDFPTLTAFALFLLLFQRSLDAPEEAQGAHHSSDHSRHRSGSRRARTPEPGHPLRQALASCIGSIGYRSC